MLPLVYRALSFYNYTVHNHGYSSADRRILLDAEYTAVVMLWNILEICRRPVLVGRCTYVTGKWRLFFSFFSFNGTNS